MPESNQVNPTTGLQKSPSRGTGYVIGFSEPVSDSDIHNIDISKYERYVPHGDVFVNRGLEQARAAGQSGIEQFGAMLNQAIVGEIVGGTIEGIGYLLDIEQYGNLAKGIEQEFGNALSDLGKSLKTWTKEATPIYTDYEPGAFAPGNWSWWMSNMSSIASTLSLMIPAAGVVRGASMLGRAAGLSAKLGKGAKWAVKGITQAVASRHMENLMEASQTLEETREMALKAGKSPEEAQRLAAIAAADSYKRNWVMLAQDIPQYLLLGRAFGKSAKLPTIGVAKRMGYDLAPIVGKKAAAIGWDMLGEFGEEAYQYVTSEESKYLVEKMLNPELEATFGDRMDEYLRDGELWTAGFFGALGAGAMQTAGRALNDAITGKGNTENARRLKNIEGWGPQIKFWNTEIRKAEERGDVNAKLHAEAGLVGVMGAKAAEIGNLQQLIDLFETTTKEGGPTKEDLDRFGLDEEDAATIKEKFPKIVEQLQDIGEKFDTYNKSYDSDIAAAMANGDFQQSQLYKRAKELQTEIESHKSNIVNWNEHSIIGKEILGLESNIRAVEKHIAGLKGRLENEPLLKTNSEERAKVTEQLRTQELGLEKLKADLEESKEEKSDEDVANDKKYPVEGADVDKLNELESEHFHNELTIAYLSKERADLKAFQKERNKNRKKKVESTPTATESEEEPVETSVDEEQAKDREKKRKEIVKKIKESTGKDIDPERAIDFESGTIAVKDLVSQGAQYVAFMNGQPGILYVDEIMLKFKDDKTQTETVVDEDLGEAMLGSKGILLAKHSVFNSTIGYEQDRFYIQIGSTKLYAPKFNPLKAIEEDTYGNPMSVTLKFPNGQDVTLTSPPIVQEVAYGIRLTEEAKESVLSRYFKLDDNKGVPVKDPKTSKEYEVYNRDGEWVVVNPSTKKSFSNAISARVLTAFEADLNRALETAINLGYKPLNELKDEIRSITTNLRPATPEQTNRSTDVSKVQDVKGKTDEKVEPTDESKKRGDKVEERIIGEFAEERSEEEVDAKLASEKADKKTSDTTPKVTSIEPLGDAERPSGDQFDTSHKGTVSDSPVLDKQNNVIWGSPDSFVARWIPDKEGSEELNKVLSNPANAGKITATVKMNTKVSKDMTDEAVDEAEMQIIIKLDGKVISDDVYVPRTQAKDITDATQKEFIRGHRRELIKDNIDAKKEVTYSIVLTPGIPNNIGSNNNILKFLDEAGLTLEDVDFAYGDLDRIPHSLKGQEHELSHTKALEIGSGTVVMIHTATANGGRVATKLNPQKIGEKYAKIVYEAYKGAVNNGAKARYIGPGVKGNISNEWVLRMLVSQISSDWIEQTGQDHLKPYVLSLVTKQGIQPYVEYGLDKDGKPKILVLESATEEQVQDFIQTIANIKNFTLDFDIFKDRIEKDFSIGDIEFRKGETYLNSALRHNYLQTDIGLYSGKSAYKSPLLGIEMARPIELDEKGEVVGSQPFEEFDEPDIPGQELSKEEEEELARLAKKQKTTGFLVTDPEEEAKIRAKGVEKDVAKDIDLNQTFDISDLDNQDIPYRMRDQVKNVYEKIDLTKELAWLKEILGDVSPRMLNEVVRRAVEKTRDVMGFVHDSAMVIFDDSAKGTLVHEAFELVWKELLTEGQRQRLYKEFRAKRSDELPENATDDDIREYLAEDFTQYVTTDGDIKPPTPQARSIFKQLYDFLKTLLGLNKNHIDKLYEAILRGDFKNQVDSFTNEQKVSIAKNLANRLLVENNIDNFEDIDELDYAPVKAYLNTTLEEFKKRGEQVDKALTTLSKKSELTEAEKKKVIEWTNQSLLIQKRIDVYSRILKEFDQFVQLTDDYLGTLSIVRKDGEMTGEYEQDEENEFERFFKASYEISAKDSVLTEIKLMLASLPEADPIAEQKGEKKSYADPLTGMPRFVEFSNMWADVIQLVHNAPTAEAMIERLKEKAKTSLPYYVLVYGNEKTGRVGLDTGSDLLKAKFFTTMSKHKNNFVDFRFKIFGSKIKEANIKTSFVRTDTKRYQQQWSQAFYTESGYFEGGQPKKDKLKALTTSFNRFVKEFRSDSRGELSEANFKKYFTAVLTYFNKISIPLDEGVLKAIISKHPGGLAKGLEEFVMQDMRRVFGKSGPFNTLGFGNQVKTRSGEIIPYKNIFNNERIIKKVAQAYAEENPNLTETAVLGPDGNLYFVYSQPNITSDLLVRMQDAEYVEKISGVLYNQNGQYIKQIRDGAELGIATFSTYTQENAGDAGRDFLSISPIEDFVMKVSAVAAGYIPLPTLADTKVMYMYTGLKTLKLGEEVLDKDGNFVVPEEVIEIFEGYKKDELARIKQAKKEIQWAEENKNYTRLVENYHFTKKDAKGIPILRDSSGKFTGNATKATHFNSTASVKEMLEKAIQDTINQAAELGIVDKWSDGTPSTNRMLPDELAARYKSAFKNKGLQVLLAEYAINTMMSGIETSKLLSGDPAFYKEGKTGDVHDDVSKRASILRGSGDKLATFSNPQDKTLARNHYTTLTLNTQRFNSKEIYNDLVKKHTDYYVTVRKMKRSEAKALAETMLEAYKNVDQTDAQTYITPEMFRQISKRLGQWTDAKQNALELLEGEKELTDEQKLQAMSVVMQPLKLVHFDHVFVNGLQIPVYDKMSMATLFKQVVTGTQLEALYNRMTDKKSPIDMVKFDSAVKAGNRVGINYFKNNDQAEVDTETLSRALPIYEQRFDGLYRQVVTDPHDIKRQLMGTQMKKVALSNIIKGGKYMMGGQEVTGQEVIDTVMNSLKSISEKGKNRLLSRLGLSQEDVAITDPTELLEMLKREAIMAGMPQNVVDAMEVDEMGEISIQFDALPDRMWVENRLISLVGKNTVDIKTAGGGFIQMSNFGLRKTNDLVNSDLKLFNERGKTEIMVSTGLFKDVIPEYEKLTHEQRVKWLKGNLDGLGYRIPTQGLNSMIAFEIKTFLPDTVGDTVILPTEFTALTGSDFDIDKLYLVRYNYRAKKDKIEKVKFIEGDTSTREGLDAIYEERYGGLIELFNNMEKEIDREYSEGLEGDGDTDPEVTKLLEKMLGASVEEFSDVEIDLILREAGHNLNKYNAIKEKIDNLPTKDEFAKSNFGKSLYEVNGRLAVENKLIDAYTAVLVSDNHVIENSTPLGYYTEKLKKLADFIREKEGKDRKLGALEALTPRYQAEVKSKYNDGKTGIGPFALNNVHHILSQIVDLRLLGELPVPNDWYNEGIALGMKMGKDDVTILDWISAFIDAHVDVAKDPYIIDINIVPTTYNVANLMLRSGVGAAKTGLFLAQPILKELSAESRIYRGKIKRGNRKPFYKVRDRYRRKYNINNKQLNEFRAENEGKIHTVKMYNWMLGKPTTDQKKWAMAQLIILEDFQSMQRKYGSVLSEAVQVSQIDTKKYGSNIVELNIFERRLKAILDNDNLINFDRLFSDTFLGELFNNSVDLARKMFRNLTVSSTDVFRSLVDQVLEQHNAKDGPSMAMFAQGSPTEFYKKFVNKISNNLHAVLMAEYFTSPRGLGIGEDAMKNMFFGKNTMAKVVRDIKLGKGVIGKKFAHLKNNELIKVLDPLISDTKERPDSISILTFGRLDKWARNSIIRGWAEMFNDTSENAKDVRRLAINLMSFAFFTSGFKMGLNSFYQFLPLEALEYVPEHIVDENTQSISYNEFVKDIRNQLDDPANFEKVDEVISEMYENYWEDDDLVPAVDFDKLLDIKHGNVPYPLVFTLENEELFYGWNELDQPLYRPYVKFVYNNKTYLAKFVGIRPSTNLDIAGYPVYITVPAKGYSERGSKVFEFWNETVFEENKIEPVADENIHKIANLQGYEEFQQVHPEFMKVVKRGEREEQVTSTEAQPEVEGEVATVKTDPNTPEFNKLPGPSGTPTMTYAGVGSRKEKLPKEIAQLMTEVAKELEERGYTLNTGDASGADYAFSYAVGNKVIFTVKDASNRTRTIAKEIHPNPDRLGDYALNLMARNTNQVFGANLDKPVDFVLVWTPNGETKASDRKFYGKDDPRNTGGSGQAIALASLKGIPVINMANENWREELDRILEGKTAEVKEQVSPEYNWSRFATKSSGYEVSTQGDKRFSAFNAKLADGKTIEYHYQVNVKGHSSIKVGKGKPPVNKMTMEESWLAYKALWKQWAIENPKLMDELAEEARGKILTDKFATTRINQARALAEILNEGKTAEADFSDIVNNRKVEGETETITSEQLGFNETERVANMILNKLMISHRPFVKRNRSSVKDDFWYKDPLNLARETAIELLENIVGGVFNKDKFYSLKTQQEVYNAISEVLNEDLVSEWEAKIRETLEWENRSMLTQLKETKRLVNDFIRRGMDSLSTYSEQQQQTIKEQLPSLFKPNKYKTEKQALFLAKQIFDRRINKQISQESVTNKMFHVKRAAVLKKYETLLNLAELDTDYKKRIQDKVRSEINRRLEFQRLEKVANPQIEDTLKFRALYSQAGFMNEQFQVKADLEKGVIKESSKINKLFDNIDQTVANGEIATSDTVGILQKIARDKKSQYSALASKLLPFAKIHNVKVSLRKPKEGDPLEHVGGTHTTKLGKETTKEGAERSFIISEEVLINYTSDAYKTNPERLLLHEILHTLTTIYIKSEEYKKQQENKTSPLTEFFEYVKKSSFVKRDVHRQGSFFFGDMDAPYGFENELEFVADALTNPHFISLLKAIPPMDEKKFNNIFEEILAWIASIFKIQTHTSAYEQLEDIIYGIINIQSEFDLYSHTPIIPETTEPPAEIAAQDQRGGGMTQETVARRLREVGAMTAENRMYEGRNDWIKLGRDRSNLAEARKQVGILNNKYRAYGKLVDIVPHLDSFVLTINQDVIDAINADNQVIEGRESLTREIFEKQKEILQKTFPDTEIVEDPNLPVIGRLMPDGRTIKVNPKFWTTDTLGHEFGHLLIDLIGGIKNPLVKRGLEFLKDSELERKVREKYPDLVEADDDRIHKEVIAQAVGEETAKIFKEEFEMARWERWLVRFFRRIRQLLGLESSAVRSLAKRLVKGVPLTSSEITGVAKTSYDQRLSKEEQQELLGETEISELTTAEGILDKAIQALEKKIAIYRNTGKPSGVKELENALEIIRKRENPIFALRAFVRHAERQIESINREYLKAERKARIGDPNAYSIKELYRWKDYLSAYTILEDIHSGLTQAQNVPLEYGDTRRPVRESKILGIKSKLKDLIDDKNFLSDLYVEKGTDILAKFLAPYSHRIAAEYKEKLERDYNQLSKEEKAKMSLEDYQTKYLSLNEDIIRDLTEKKIKGELAKASWDINFLSRWIDNVLDSNDTVVSAMVSAFTDADDQSRLDSIAKGKEILKALKKVEKVQKLNIRTNPKEFYKFMLEVDKDGNYTQHIVGETYSGMMQEFFDLSEKLNIELENQGKIYVVEDKNENRIIVTQSELPEDITPSVGKTIKYNKKSWTVKRIQDISEAVVRVEKRKWKDKNVPRKGENKTNWERAKREFLKSLVDQEKITHAEAASIINNDKAFGTKFHLPLYDVIDNRDAADEYIDFLKENSWSFREPAPKWRNPQYKELLKYKEQGDPRWDFYQLILNTVETADNSIPSKFRRRTKLPGLSKDFLERVQTRQSAGTIAKESTKAGVVKRPEDVEKGHVELTSEAGDPVMYVPVFYANEIEEVNQSYDIATIYHRFWDMANDYKLKSNILPEMELAKFIVQNREVLKRDEKGNIITDALSKAKERKLTKKGINSMISAQLEDWFKAVVYGQKEADEGTFGGRIDKAKAANLLNKYTAFTLLGLNVVQGVANVALGQTMQWIEAIGGEFYSVKDFAKAGLFYDKNLPAILGDVGKHFPTNIVDLINERFNTLNEYENGKYRKNSKFSNLLSTNTLFFTTHAGEHYMQSRVVIAMLNRMPAKDKDGKVIGKMLDYLYVKDGELAVKDEVRNFGLEEQKRFGQRARRLLSRIHGEYNAQGRVAIQRYAIGRMGYMFRKFVVQGYKRRWEKKKFNELLDEFTEGNYITTSRFVINLFKDMKLFHMSLASEEWTKLTRVEKANIRRTLGELMFLTATVIMMSVFLKMKDDDDDDGWLISFLAYQAVRLKSELLFFSPKLDEAMRIMRSPAAAMSVIENVIKLSGQIWTPFERYERGNWKGKPKIMKTMINFVPGWKQMYRLKYVDDQINWFIH